MKKEIRENNKNLSAKAVKEREEYLKKLRGEIDSVDDKIVKLLIKRIKLVIKIGKYKKKNNIPLHAPEREDEILKRIDSRIDKPVLKNAIDTVYKTVIKISRAVQKKGNDE